MRQARSPQPIIAFLLVLGAAFAVPSPALAGFEVNQLPGGNYRGLVAGGKPIQIEVHDRGARGVLRLRCAKLRDRFRIRDDGSFRVRKRNRGKVVLRVRGRFDNLTRARGRVVRLARGGRRCKEGRFRAGLRNVRGVKRTKVRYGPYHVEPSNGGDHGSHGDRLGGNVLHDDVPKPCEDCYVIGMLPSVAETAGARASHLADAMLHHIVFFNQDREDATCEGPLLGWERFFAAGSELSMLVLPAGYGYRIASGDTWWTLAHLMNMGDHALHASVEVTFWYVDAPASLREVKPFWFDINNCGNSEYTTPAGLHTETRDFRIPAALAGDVVALGGHVHDYGIAVELTNESRRGQRICRAVADYGAGHLERIRGCVGDPLGTFRTGERVRLHSTYRSPVALHDAMGIMLGYLAPSPID
jgi:hypothetical protein